MYYSRLLLNLDSSYVRKDLANDHEMHRTVMSGFPHLQVPQDDKQRQRKNPQAASILWRVDHDLRRENVMLIVQSDCEPDWQPLLVRFPGYVTESPDAETPSISTMERQLSFRREQHLKFRLRANPTRKVKTVGRKNGKRLGLTTPVEQCAWLERKTRDSAHPLGFVIRNFHIIPNPGGGKHRIATTTQDTENLATATKDRTFVAVLFEGVLEVTDVELFQQSLRSGIGSAKAFGFGLLSVARL